MHGAWGRLAGQGNRNLNLNLLATLNSKQVNVVDVEGQDVLVNVLNHGQVLLAVDLQLQNGVDTVVADEGLDVQQRNCEVNRLLVGTVDDAWDLPVAAQAACDTLAKLGTCFSLDYWALCHASFSLVKVVRRGQRDKNDESLPMDVLDESSQAYIKATCSNFNRVDNGFLILRSPSPRLG